MSKKLFSDIEVTKLSKNKNISKVSKKAITYTFEFKKKFIDEYKTGKLTRIIFEEAGLDIEILGKKRIHTASDRWRKAFKEQGELGLKDTRKNSSRKPLKRELTDLEKIKRLEAQIEYLKIENEFDTIFNLKKIRRIMKKYGIICPHRKPNPYKNIAKATREHSTVPNILNREFKQEVPRKILLTDISYLTYGNGKRAYLSTIKDSSTNEILAHEVSHSLSLDIALNTVKGLARRRFKLHPECIIHSDQGFHYTNPKFQKLVKSNKIIQSMSRKGNCWDNAPMESFFGHMKDEINFKPLKTLGAVKKELSKYMNYYNNHRYQWNLKKMTPVQY